LFSSCSKEHKVNIDAEAVMRLALAALVLGAATAPLGAAELLGPRQLETGWFDGRTVSTVGPRGGKSSFAFLPGGKLTRTGGRAGAAGEGTWRLDDLGFCMTLGDAKRESCYLAAKADDGTLKVMRRSGGAFVWTR
jgi:hypothetical protein